MTCGINFLPVTEYPKVIQQYVFFIKDFVILAVMTVSSPTVKEFPTPLALVRKICLYFRVSVQRLVSWTLVHKIPAVGACSPGQR